MESPALSSTSDSKEPSKISPGLTKYLGDLEFPGCASNTPAPGVLERYHNIEKSPTDKYSYRGILLTNRLKVVLASNPAADTSAAALEVQVGYYSDPDEIPGLAHLCEHMLFLGTEKYSKEVEFKKTIAEHGGSSKSFITPDRTVFHFKTASPYLNKTLDMFAQFFMSPLFNESVLSRELNAVRSEFKDQIIQSSGEWRLFELEKSLSNPNIQRSETDSKETLQTILDSKGIDMRKELLNFYEKWYSSNIMSLVIAGNESLDELEAMVAPLFSAIKDKSVAAPSWPLNPLRSKLCGKKIYSLPVRDTSNLYIDFAIPCTKKHSRTEPAGYVAHLISHEGPGSLLSALKRHGWCNKLNSTAVAFGRGFEFYSIEVDLTDEGIKNTDDIISLVFQYIAMLKTEDPQRSIWKEQKYLSKSYFQLQDVSEAGDLALEVVQRLQLYPMEEVLFAHKLKTEWKLELIIELISLLTPENAVVTLYAKAFEDKCTLTDRYYETKYGYEDIDESTLKIWKEVQPSEEFFLPPPDELRISGKLSSGKMNIIEA